MKRLPIDHNDRSKQTAHNRTFTVPLPKISVIINLSGISNTFAKTETIVVSCRNELWSFWSFSSPCGTQGIFNWTAIKIQVIIPSKFVLISEGRRCWLVVVIDLRFLSAELYSEAAEAIYVHLLPDVRLPPHVCTVILWTPTHLLSNILIQRPQLVYHEGFLVFLQLTNMFSYMLLIMQSLPKEYKTIGYSVPHGITAMLFGIKIEM